MQVSAIKIDIFCDKITQSPEHRLLNKLKFKKSPVMIKPAVPSVRYVMLARQRVKRLTFLLITFTSKLECIKINDVASNKPA